MAHKPSILPFASVNRRELLVRVVLLNACFFGMIACAPLWSNEHSFPLLRIAPWFPLLPLPWDKVLFGAMLLSLIAAAWFFRAAVGFFLVAGFFVYCEDENRGQPWFYMYWVLLLLTLFGRSVAIAGCRIAMSAVYFWSGIQKCNARFFHIQPEWFVEPAEHWHLPAFALNLMHWAVAVTPFVELGIGLALWSPRLRRAALIAAIVVHGGALVLLGPLGHDYNWVVWPWNLAMPALLWVLFAKGAWWEKRADEPPAVAAQPDKKSSGAKDAIKKKPEVLAAEATLKQSLLDLTRSKPALVVVALFSLLPVLGYYGLWDSYFSFCLYSENSATANIFVTPDFAERLPANMKTQVQPFSQNFDPQYQGPLEFVYGGWCYEELGVPPIAEPRNFVSIFKALQTWSKGSSDLRMIIGPRAGPVVFYEGDSRQFLTAQ